MKKGIISLLAVSTLFSLGLMGQSEKVEAAGETWNLVKNVDSLSVGDKVVVAAKDFAFALSTTQNTNNRGQASITKNGDTVSFGDDVQILTLEAGKTAGTYGFSTGEGYLYAASSSKNYLRTETALSANSSWTISIDSNAVATVKATGSNSRNMLQYNKSSSLFSSYSSAQQNIVIYELDDGNTGGDSGETPAEKTPTEEVNVLLTSYYNNGNYLRHTEINLNETAKNELAKYWHAGSDLLERYTYFVGEELWMLNEKGSYSYYGTEDNNMVSARTENPLYQPKSTHVAIKGKTMEQYYTTMHDIKDNKAEWTKNGNIYSTNDKTVVKMFLDFTAPCLYDVTEENNNYLSYNGVEVEETSEGLVLRLKVTILEIGKLATENGVLSTATITKQSNSVTITNVADALTSSNGTKLHLEGTVCNKYTSGDNFYLLDETGDKILVYSDVSVNLDDKVIVSGEKYNSSVKSGCTIDIIDNGNYVVNTHEVSIEEVYSFGQNSEEKVVSRDKYKVTGIIKIIDDKCYISDGDNNILLYGGDTANLHNGYTATIKGYVAKYSGEIEFVNFEVSDIVECTYNLSIESVENGTINYEGIESLTGIAYGTEVTLKFIPNSGYEVNYIVVNGITQSAPANNELTLTIEGNTTVNAVFKETVVGVEKYEETLDIKANAGALSTDKLSISWTGNNVVFTNNKASSSTAIRTSDSDHFRVYANSALEIGVTATNATITKIVITCNSSDYATVLKNSVGSEATASGSVVTIIPTESSNAYVVEKITAQTRVSKVVITYEA